MMTKRSAQRPLRERVMILVDGSNFYHRLRDSELRVRHLLQFDYRRFAEWLAQERRIVARRYYVGLIRREQDNLKSDQLVRDQQRLFAHLNRSGWEVVTGYMMRHGQDYKEKGVDVRMAIDLLDGAYRNQFSTAILVSSDTDLIPVVERVQRLGKLVEYIGFSHRPSYGLLRHARIRRLLARSDLEPFMRKEDNEHKENR